jgi:hypothetical protein
MGEFVGSRTEAHELVDLLITNDREAYAKGLTTTRQAAAHVFACIQSMHAVADTLSHAIYFGLGMNVSSRTELPSTRVGLHLVHKALIDHAIASDVAACVGTLCSHEDYLYVAALVNQSKYRRIVSPQFSVNLTSEGMPAGLRFEAFEHHGKQYQARWVETA